jgi:hypothetical protein
MFDAQSMLFNFQDGTLVSLEIAEELRSKKGWKLRDDGDDTALVRRAFTGLKTVR